MPHILSHSKLYLKHSTDTDYNEDFVESQNQIYFSFWQKLLGCQSKTFRENVVSLKSHYSQAKPSTPATQFLTQEVSGSNSEKGEKWKAITSTSQGVFSRQRDERKERMLLKVAIPSVAAGYWQFLPGVVNSDSNRGRFCLRNVLLLRFCPGLFEIFEDARVIVPKHVNWARLFSCHGVTHKLGWLKRNCSCFHFCVSPHFSIRTEKRIVAQGEVLTEEWTVKRAMVIWYFLTGNGRCWLLGEWIIQTDCNRSMLLYCISSFSLSLCLLTHIKHTLSHTHFCYYYYTVYYLLNVYRCCGFNLICGYSTASLEAYIPGLNLYKCAKNIITWALII